MPPRRSVARSAATPARSTRGSSAVALESSATRRITRGSSQQPNVNDDVINNPKLPELQTQQSYAYGATKTPLLPEQLVARDKMTFKEMAETIDAGVRQADRHFENHVAEIHGGVESNPQSQSQGTRRKTSKEASSEPALAPDKLGKDKNDRIAAWADSVDTSELENIQEEDSPEPATPDDSTRRGTDPSSFPSGIYDHSYSYERGLRKPHSPQVYRHGLREYVNKLWETFKTILVQISSKTSNIVSVFRNYLQNALDSCSRVAARIPVSTIVPVMINTVIGLVCASVVGFVFCSLYSNYLCQPASTSALGTYLDRLCGSCRANQGSFNLTQDEIEDLGGTKFTSVMQSISKQISNLESRLHSKQAANHKSIQSELDSLRKEYNELSIRVAQLDGSGKSPSSDGSVPSPLLSHINFFAPANGAIINPYHTSPTRQKPHPLPQRVLMRMLGLNRYQSKPAIIALEPWLDVGDCWCSSNAPANRDFARLGVMVQEHIYPTEMVVEHFPTAGSLTPDTAPKSIELWADFEHLDDKEWQKLNIRQLQDDGVFGPTYAMIARVQFDASVRANHIQTFRLNVNQHELLHYARQFIVRVVSNYGAEHVCLYRIRLHGMPVAVHSEAIGTTEWYEQHGYQTEAS